MERRLKKSEALFLMVVAVSLALAGVEKVAGQTPQGTFRGVVRDTTGAVVPRVNVTVTDERTTFSRSALADVHGEYEIPYVDPGTYTVSAEKSGFRKYVNSSIALNVSEIKRVDIVLEVGSVATQVTVRAEAPAITTDKSEIVATMNARDIDYLSTIRIGDGPARFQSGSDPTSGSGQLGFVGSRDADTKMALDGVECNFYQMYLPVDAVADVQLHALDSPAEYMSANELAAVTASGSNMFHGRVADFMRNSGLEALDAESHVRPADVPTNVFHGYVGGPVYIPHLYNGRDRTFFHFAWEDNLNTLTAGGTSAIVPTHNMKTGDLSIFTQPIMNPLTGRPFAGNQISSISPVSAAMLAFYPDPVSPGLSNNWSESYRGTNTSRKYVARIDQKLSSKNTLSGTWSGWVQGGSGIPASGLMPTYDTQATSSSLYQQWAIGDTHVFSPHIVNEARFGYFRNGTGSTDPRSIQPTLSKLGLLGVTSVAGGGGPNVSITGFTGLGTPGNSTVHQERIHYLDNLTITKGAHILKLGLEARNFPENNYSLANTVGGSFIFNGFYTGNAFADFLLGVPNEIIRTTPRAPVLGNYTEWGAFVQDDWKVSSRLTFNYGIRYSLTTVVTDKSGLYFNFDPKTASIVVPGQQALATVVPGWPATVPVITAAQAGFPAGLRAGDHHDLFPRIGFAYRPFANNNTVIRGGYGIYVVPLSYSSLQTGGPFTLTEDYFNSVNSAGVPSIAFPTPFPSGPGVVATPSATAIAQNFKVPYTQQWNLTVEREIASHTGLRVSYMGNKDTQLGYQRNIDQPIPSTTPYAASSLPYPSLVKVTSVENGGNGNYNGLEISVTRQMFSGLQIKSGEMWAHGLSDIADTRFQNETGAAIQNAYCRRCDYGEDDFVPRHKWVTEWVWDVPVGKGKRFLPSMPSAVNEVLGEWSVSGLTGFLAGEPFSVVYSGADPSDTNTFSGRADLVPGCNPNLSNRTHAEWFNVSCFVTPPVHAGRFGTVGRNTMRGPSTGTLDLSVFKDFPIHERLKLRLWVSGANVLNHPAWAPPQDNITAANVGQIYTTNSTLGIYQGYDARRIEFDFALDW